MRDIEFTFKGLLIRFSLALSDLIFFNASLFIAVLLINALPGNLLDDISTQDLQLKIVTHIILSVICIGWFWVRQRHYTYRKPFWFELKEIYRTILIFSVIDLSITALSKWELSRWVWVMTWILAMIFIPVGRAVVKRVLNHYGMWKKQSIIIGSGKNAEEAYLAQRAKR